MLGMEQVVRIQVLRNEENRTYREIEAELGELRRSVAELTSDVGHQHVEVSTISQQLASLRAGVAPSSSTRSSDTPDGHGPQANDLATVSAQLDEVVSVVQELLDRVGDIEAGRIANGEVADRVTWHATDLDSHFVTRSLLQDCGFPAICFSSNGKEMVSLPLVWSYTANGEMKGMFIPQGVFLTSGGSAVSDEGDLLFPEGTIAGSEFHDQLVAEPSEDW